MELKDENFCAWKESVFVILHLCGHCDEVHRDVCYGEPKLAAMILEMSSFGVTEIRVGELGANWAVTEMSSAELAALMARAVTIIGRSAG
jgi:hypothetical protein